MKKILIISDTHNYLDDKLIKYIEQADEVWHGGDIGTYDLCKKIEKLKPLKAVWGNIDDHQIRMETKEIERFQIEQVSVLMMHIGGRPEKYAKSAFEELSAKALPKLFICGHSHIALIKMDKRFNMLWMNPGACGYKGFHAVKTIVRFCITDDRIHNLELIELGKRV